jgi:predicted short-subunit dehydrogenase-like oxidoreductase (DUF2520 family)
MRTVRIIGSGRAGRSFAGAIDNLSGWDVVEMCGRGVDLTDAAGDVDLLLIATPDESVAEVAATVTPGSAVVAHVAGSLGLDVLAGHHRVAALHPLTSLPNPVVGAQRLLGGWFAIAGDPLVGELAADLGGQTFSVEDQDRPLYHAAAAVAANHLVALLGQVERLGGAAGVPLEALFALARHALDNASELGPAAALTGPAARGDEATIEAHRDALQRRLPDELAAYDALLELARRLIRDGQGESR